jgi:hypothetical protein
VEKTLKGSGSYSDRFLKRERLHWHPVHFSGRVQHQELAQEMFVLIQRLVDGDGKKDGGK